jgi:hypothetical protein
VAVGLDMGLRGGEVVERETAVDDRADCPGGTTGRRTSRMSQEPPCGPGTMIAAFIRILPSVCPGHGAQNSNASTIIGSFFAAAIHSCIAGIAMIVSQ